MRYSFGFICVLALGVMGCSETAGTGGAAGDGGEGGGGGIDLCEGVTCDNTECMIDGWCVSSDYGGNLPSGSCFYDYVYADGTPCSQGECIDGVCAAADAFPCTEQGIRDAIAQGGGPHYFACDGPTTVVIGNWGIGFGVSQDVILDGEGKLTIESKPTNCSNCYLRIDQGVAAELKRLSVTGYIENEGALTLRKSAFFSDDYGIVSSGTLTLLNSTVSSTEPHWPALIALGELTVVNSTISGEAEDNTLHLGPFCLFGPCWDEDDECSGVNATFLSSTVVGGVYTSCDAVEAAFERTLAGPCYIYPDSSATSLGHNIESPGDTCGFDQATDQVDVSADDLKLGPLQDNGGPTETHALGEGSVAIDQIPAEDCVDADDAPLTTDQRGEPRPEPGGTDCDVGAFEVQP